MATTIRASEGPDEYCLNLLLSLQRSLGGKLIFIIGNLEVTFNKEMICYFSPFLSSLLNGLGCGSCLNEPVFISLPTEMSPATILFLQTVLEKGVIHQIGMNDIDDVKDIVDILGLLIDLVDVDLDHVDRDANAPHGGFAHIYEHITFNETKIESPNENVDTLVRNSDSNISTMNADDIIYHVEPEHLIQIKSESIESDDLTQKAEKKTSTVGAKAENAEFHSVEVTDIDSIVKFRNYIHAKHGSLDILVNNVGQYFEPSEDPIEHFRQVQKTMMANYWGTKNICKAFIPMLAPQARIVNLSSHLGHVSLVPGQLLRERLCDPDLSEQGLDRLVMEYQDHCAAHTHDFAEHGWPSCAYTVSKVAVNAYTRILQSYLETHRMPDVVVNAIHPGSYHSKISQKSPLTAVDAAKAVVCCALLSHPCHHPRGKFIWHDLQIIDWTQGDLKGMWA